MSLSKICAITGSNGYVGSGIKGHFTARGWATLDLVRQPEARTGAATFRLGDDVSIRTLAGVNTLVHCAYDFKPLHPDQIHSVNVEGSRKLFQAAAAAGVEKIIYISSISAYPGCRSLYGRAKLEIEKDALERGALVIRPGLVYGRGPGGMFGKLTTQIRQSSIIPLIGDGSQIQYLVHLDDLATFIENEAGDDGRLSPRILTAASTQPWMFRHLLEAIARALGKHPKFIPLPGRLVWAALKSAEACGLQLNFRSDSLVSLMHPNPQPDFSANLEAGLDCRPFEVVRLLF